MNRGCTRSCSEDPQGVREEQPNTAAVEGEGGERGAEGPMHRLFEVESRLAPAPTTALLLLGYLIDGSGAGGGPALRTGGGAAPRTEATATTTMNAPGNGSDAHKYQYQQQQLSSDSHNRFNFSVTTDVVCSLGESHDAPLLHHMNHHGVRGGDGHGPHLLSFACADVEQFQQGTPTRSSSSSSSSSTDSNFGADAATTAAAATHSPPGARDRSSSLTALPLPAHGWMIHDHSDDSFSTGTVSRTLTCEGPPPSLQRQRHRDSEGCLSPAPRSGASLLPRPPAPVPAHVLHRGEHLQDAVDAAKADEVALPASELVSSADSDAAGELERRHWLIARAMRANMVGGGGGGGGGSGAGEEGEECGSELGGSGEGGRGIVDPHYHPHTSASRTLTET